MFPVPEDSVDPRVFREVLARKDPKATLALWVHLVTKVTEAQREDLENRVPLDPTAHEVHPDP